MAFVDPAEPCGEQPVPAHRVGRSGRSGDPAADIAQDRADGDDGQRETAGRAEQGRSEGEQRRLLALARLHHRDEGELDQEVESGGRHDRGDEGARDGALRVGRFAGGDDAVLEADEGIENQERRRLELGEGRRTLDRIDRGSGDDQPRQRHDEQGRRLEQGERVEQPNRAFHPDGVDEDQGGDHGDDDGAAGDGVGQRRPELAEVGDEDRQVRGQRGRPSDVIKPAGLEGRDGAEHRDVDDRSAGDPMMGGDAREGQRDHQHQQAEKREEVGAEGAELFVQRARQREDAGADDSVERQEGRAEKADVAAKRFVLGHAHPITPRQSRRFWPRRACAASPAIGTGPNRPPASRSNN